MPEGTTTRSVTLDDSAAARITKLREIEGNPDLKLRISVNGGGCSGFSYVFDFADAIGDDDHEFANGDVSLVIDDVSLDLLTGSVVKFNNDLMGSYFTVENPQAASSCGCGTSFSIG
ncbi:MAG: iron-sulfur cluster insertion protein ErpA [Alphaproteobacteria bacterium]